MSELLPGPPSKIMFSMMVKNWRRGDKFLSEKKTGEALEVLFGGNLVQGFRHMPETVLFLEMSPSESISRAIIENMISPDYVLCYIIGALEIVD